MSESASPARLLPDDLTMRSRVSPRRMAAASARGDRGSAAVEFALVLPILLTVVFGIVQYGWYFYSVQAGSDAARDAARRAAVSDLIPCVDFRGEVENALSSYTSGATVPTVTRVYYDAAGAAVSPAVVGNSVRVEVEFQSIDFGLPFIPLADSGLITTSAEARVESIGLTSAPVACT